MKSLPFFTLRERKRIRGEGKESESPKSKSNYSVKCTHTHTHQAGSVSAGVKPIKISSPSLYRQPLLLKARPDARLKQHGAEREKNIDKPQKEGTNKRDTQPHSCRALT